MGGIGVAWGQPRSYPPYQAIDTQKKGEHPPTPEEALGMITVPDGFSVTLFAGDPHVRQPIAMEFDDRGRLWVAEAYSYKEWKKKGEDRLVIFEDTDGDGRFDERTIFWDKGNHLSGFALAGDGVWICDSPNLSFLPDRDRDDVPDGRPEVMLDGWTTRAGHNFYNGLVWGPDGWLYGRHGITAPSLVGPPGTPEAERTFMDCSIWRWHPVEKRFELVVRGTTNPWGFDWNETGDMFMSGNVNGHFWHVLPGARYIRMHGEGHVPYTYERMRPTADHVHHEGKWTDRRNWRYGKANDIGGGHSHCGLVIYQGANFPEPWRGKAFMCNTHGNRINMDHVTRTDSGYVATHGKDFLMTTDEWFRGTAIVTGPDGAMYVADWSDFGECHDNDGVHRNSGRIYKIKWDADSRDPEPVGDLRERTVAELNELLNHEDVWWRRKARRILMERARAGSDLGALHKEWEKIFCSGSISSVQRLRALWACAATGGTRDPILRTTLLGGGDDHVRAWAARLLAGKKPIALGDSRAFNRQAVDEPSSFLRMHLAGLAQNVPVSERRHLAESLVHHQDIIGDRKAELMVWYAIEPLMTNATLVAEFLDLCYSPLLVELMVRRLAEDREANLEPVLDSVEAFAPGDGLYHERLAAVLDGLAASWRGRNHLARPDKWTVLEAKVERAGDDELSLKLAKLDAHFRSDGRDVAGELTLLADRTKTAEERELGLRTLVQSTDGRVVPALLAQVADPEVGPEVITALAGFNDKRVTDHLVSAYPDLQLGGKQRALHALASRADSADALLDAVRKGNIPKADLTSLHARQMASHRDRYLQRKLALVFGKVSQTPAAKKKEIAKWERQLTPQVLAAADLKNGQALYQQRCAACHVLYGEGGTLGPDLTGANRDSVYYLIENMVDPNAVVSHDARLTTVKTKDGRVVAGMVLENSQERITVGMIGAEVVVPREDVLKIDVLERSLMPEGLLKAMTEEQVRDLIGFLQARK